MISSATPFGEGSLPVAFSRLRVSLMSVRGKTSAFISGGFLINIIDPEERFQLHL
jgi:hypothetical protein